ncbi:MAG: Uncharacterized protein G01um101418_331 [Parcubacteria group bacterium Gr01-1014_18]|nr:MAG: Uncharacterized protein Greene041636_293 [Parcubacteria group bacterium Greene0416_36]TSC81191.1 MAG: Uncharacterized protein G01um101418_331 [Parcubacteria group bacterium Gr01-1014_18]TSC99188.1 MAG: Uncharacterized protein Greene101420_333 [Parcubacteria group bacterium Greene1014_20]TSD07454.1 MAG: Uncharacterized protein Greene07142_153 [Parcubacteria group bacterium Greene0714_2]
MNITKYEVVFESFTERHFIKTFARKYKSAWDLTYSFLVEEFGVFDVLFNKNMAQTIIDSADIKICKTEFKISGTQESRHGSGNRCIVAIHKNINRVSVLLVYHKNDLTGSNETASWKNLVRDNYPEYSGIL